MYFNVDKRKVLHIGTIINTQNVQLMALKFPKLSLKKNFGITTFNDLKRSKHCSDVVKKAIFFYNKLILFIGRTFEYKSEKNYPYTI